jgi:3-oxoacyl-[acyl-carrier-protein] synthase III
LDRLNIQAAIQQRLLENGADGISDMAGEAARVAVEPSGSERDTIDLVLGSLN